ncbi:MAG: 1-deoxy-D-xylulose-5-phosphate synthase, partial [Armatimonadetes bacterium]|nr:1-deoxy-D-xylulose-5-phosphate synthase [Armatimonadota bacterium]
VCMAPADEGELRRMLATALALDGPAAIRDPRGAGPQRGLDEPMEPLEVGRAQLLRECGDVAILALGAMVPAALEAADILAAQGVAAAVVNARFAKPLDAELICDLAQRCAGLVTVEENAAAGGFGSGVVELLAARGFQVPVRVLGLPDSFVPHGDRQQLLGECGLDAEGIAQACRELA